MARHHPYSGYDATGPSQSGSGLRRGGSGPSYGRGDRGRGGAGAGGSQFPGSIGDGAPQGFSGTVPSLENAGQSLPTSSAVPIRVGFDTPARPLAPPASIDPSYGQPPAPIHLQGRDPHHLRPLPAPLAPGHTQQYSYPTSAPPQVSHYPFGPPPPPPHHHPSQPSNHHTNNYGQRGSTSNDSYVASSDVPLYTQSQDFGYPPRPASHSSGVSLNPPYGSYPPYQPSDSYDGPNREPSYGPDRSRSGPHGREAADPYSRPATDSRPPPAAPAAHRFSGSKDFDPRTADEKPCRTLFVRNLDNSTSSSSIRDHFLQFGEIKTFFDRIANKGMCFITFYDLRGAEWAKKTCHQQEFNGKKMDVHYSLPKEQDTSKRCDRDQNQGTLFMLLKRIARALTDDEFSSIFSAYGEVKGVRKYKDQKNARFLEFYDSRACVAAHDAMGGQLFMDPTGNGEWDVKFAWDAQQIGKGRGQAGSTQQREMAVQSSVAVRSQPPSYVSGWSPPPPASYQTGGSSMGAPVPAAGYDARPPPSGGPNSYPPPGHSAGSYGHMPTAVSPPRPPPLAQSPLQGPAQWGVRRAPATPSSLVSSVASVGGEASSSSRLEQAQKVQQLLASLSSDKSQDGNSLKMTASQALPPPGPAEGHNGRMAGATDKGLPPHLVQLLAGVSSGGEGGGAQPPRLQQPQRSGGGLDPRKSSTEVGSSQGQGGGTGGEVNSNSAASNAQESIQRMLSMLGQQQQQQQR